MSSDEKTIVDRYRAAANELPDASLDRRILARARAEPGRRRAPWRLAVAASLIVGVVWSGFSLHRLRLRAHDPLAGFEEGRARAELLEMPAADSMRRSAVARRLIEFKPAPAPTAPSPAMSSGDAS